MLTHGKENNINFLLNTKKNPDGDSHFNSRNADKLFTFKLFAKVKLKITTILK